MHTLIDHLFYFLFSLNIIYVEKSEIKKRRERERVKDGKGERQNSKKLFVM
jgi:hypothetical protein